MKLLKIFAAVLLFGLAGSIQNQVLAQVAGGYWHRTLSNSGYLTNESVRARIENDANNKHQIKLVIYKWKTDAVVKSLLLSDDRRNGAVESISITQNSNDDVVFRIETEGNTVDINLSAEGRKKISDEKYRVLDTEKETIPSAYFQLESDGRFVIYHGTVGVFGSKGTPILEFVKE